MIPPVIRALGKLCVFIASDNMVDDISPLIDCKDLKTIDLRRNNVKIVPVEFPLKLSNLSKLLLEDVKSSHHTGSNAHSTREGKSPVTQYSFHTSRKEYSLDNTGALDKEKKEKSPSSADAVQKVQCNNKAIVGLSIKRGVGDETPFSSNIGTKPFPTTSTGTGMGTGSDLSPFSNQLIHEKHDPFSFKIEKNVFPINSNAPKPTNAKYPSLNRNPLTANDKPKCDTNPIKPDERPAYKKETVKPATAPLPMGMVHYNQHMDAIRKRRKESKNNSGFKY